MMKKEERNKIDKSVEKNYPNIQEYSLKCVADEIIHHALHEALNDEYILDVSEIKENFELNQSEMLKVLYLIKHDQDNIKKGNFQFGHPNYFVLKLENAKINGIRNEITDVISNIDAYDSENNGIKLFGRNWMKGLIFSIDQASKVIDDILFKIYKKMHLDRQEEECKKIVEEYANEHNLELTQIETENGTENALIGKNIYLYGTYLQIAKNLKINELDFGFDISEIDKKNIEDTYKEYQNLIKNEQIKGFVKEQLKVFEENQPVILDQDEEWFQMDDTVEDINKILKQYDPNFDKKERISNEQFIGIKSDTYQMINKQYENIREKEQLEMIR